MREANDRGYECIIPEDCVGSYFPEFQKYALEMIKAQGAIFGWVTDSKAIIAGLEGQRRWYRLRFAHRRWDIFSRRMKRKIYVCIALLNMR